MVIGGVSLRRVAAKAAGVYWWGMPLSRSMRMHVWSGHGGPLAKGRFTLCDRLCVPLSGDGRRRQRQLIPARLAEESRVSRTVVLGSA